MLKIEMKESEKILYLLREHKLITGRNLKMNKLLLIAEKMSYI